MTSDPILLKAMESLRLATEQVREWEAFIAKYRSLTNGESHQLAENATEMKPTPPPDTKPWPTDKILLAAGDVLSVGGPMPLARLYDALVARGAVIGGKNPRNNLCAKLSADARFASDKVCGWWFAGEQLPGEHRTARGRLPVEENEEGPEPIGAEPLHMNGATGLTTY